MRKSTERLPSVSEIRPSWGTRCSAMFMSAMTFRRVTTAAAIARGAEDMS